jgi:beta-lactamase regulating signal transducer with metallopeptidase domain
MLIHHLLGDAVRVAVLLALTLLAMPLLRGASSATRRLVLALSLGGALALPLVAAAVPVWRVHAPEAVTSLGAVMVSEPLRPANRAARVSTPAEAAPGSSLRPEPTATFDATTLAASLWAVGAALVLLRLVVGLVKTRHIVRRAVRAHAWSLAAARAGRATGQRVEVRSTSRLDAPAVAGVVSPVILVPEAASSWTEERRYAVLLHELAHVRQWDCLAQLIAQLACAMHWFNPLAWLTARRLRAERELAADDAVVEAGARASSYAEDLLAIASVAGVARDVPSGALGMAERSLIAARVTAIVSARRLRRPPSPVAAALLVASVGSGVLVVACATPEAVTATNADPSPATASPAPELAGSSIDPGLQSIAEEELGRVMDQRKPAAGVVLVLDPSTGEILANAGRAHGAPADVAVRSAYTPGSTMKAFTLAAALEEGVLSPTESIDCEHGAWSYHGAIIHDWRESGALTVPEVLAVSSNIGFGKIYDRVGPGRLGRWLRAFHFGSAPVVEGAVSGAMPERIDDRKAQGVLVAIGEGLTASPLQVAAAYASLANGGFYVAPTLTHRTGDAPREAILKPETARTVVSLLEHVVSGGEQATGTEARVDGQRVAGKTGTAAWTLPDGSERYYSSFVGIIPSTSPRFVILVGLEEPLDDDGRPGDGGGGGHVAAPVFARVATRALAR